MVVGNAKLQCFRVAQMRILVSVLALVGLVACTNPPVEEAGAGVGFNTYSDYQSTQLQRENLLNGTISTTAISSETISPGLPRPVTATAARTADLNNPGISDEQDFSAVASRETIESDKQRIEANREAYQVIRPTALPTRSGDSGPSIVEYALSTRNRVGEPLYARSRMFAESRFNKNCAKYPSPDQAQQAFLKAGGPKRDSKGLDPDGDGFACYWDPTPFRRAVSN